MNTSGLRSGLLSDTPWLLIHSLIPTPHFQQSLRMLTCRNSFKCVVCCQRLLYCQTYPASKYSLMNQLVSFDPRQSTNACF
jgi:hypothetical protein